MLVSAAQRLILAAVEAAFSGLSINGIRIASNLTDSNCDSTEWLNVSAVMPVLSETINTVLCMVDEGIE